MADWIGRILSKVEIRQLIGHGGMAEVYIGFGHNGSMMTMHAIDPEDALTRIEAMCLMANLGLGLSEIRFAPYSLRCSCHSVT